MSTHKIVPYEILQTIIQNSSNILEAAFKDQMEILKAFVRAVLANVNDCVKKAEGGSPIVGHHFAFPGEFFPCGFG